MVALAIALVLEGASRKVAAESCGMDHQTLRDWIHRYNAEGVDGLRDRGGRGVKPYLTSDQLAQLATWVKDSPDAEQDGVVRWRQKDLVRRIEITFVIKLHERTIGTYLGNYMRKCASGGQSLANAERGVGMCGFAGKIDTEFFITNVLLCIT